MLWSNFISISIQIGFHGTEILVFSIFAENEKQIKGMHFNLFIMRLSIKVANAHTNVQLNIYKLSTRKLPELFAEALKELHSAHINAIDYTNGT